MITYILGALTVVYGCSEPEGGYQEPTPADNVYYSKHVAVGEVTDLVHPDPMFGDMYGSTYGAMVNVQCTYKGGPLPARIQIGGAGFIPGHCSSKELEKGKKYVLFLEGKRENEDMYEQSQPAVLKDKLMDYLRVCDLNMEYPVENGIVLKRAECPRASKLDTCQRHGDAGKSIVKPKPVDMQGQASEEKKSTSVGKSSSSDGSGSSNVMSSLITLLFSVVFLCL